MRLFDDLNFDYLSKRKITYVVSSTLIIISLLSFAFRGIELGIDFKGGTEIALKFQNPLQ